MSLQMADTEKVSETLLGIVLSMCGGWVVGDQIAGNIPQMELRSSDLCLHVFQPC